MPIAKAVDPQYRWSSSLQDDDDPPYPTSLQQDSTHQLRDYPSSAADSSRPSSTSKYANSDLFADDPLALYRQEQLELERRRHMVRIQDDSCAGFVEWVRLTCGDIVENEKFQAFILVCICVNSLMFGLITYPMIKDDPSLSAKFAAADMVFLVIFTIDIAMQLTSLGRNYFRNGWLLFDLLVIIISWLSMAFSGLYALRVFRAFRLITRVEMMRNVVVVLFHVVPALMGITVMLALVMYIYAVLCTDLFRSYYPGVSSGDYFGRIDATFFTLFQFICMDEWAGIASEIVQVSYWSWAIFISFIVITGFVVVNLMIAVICDAVGILRTAEQAMLYGFNPDDDDNDEQVQEGNDLQRKVKEMQEMLDELEVAQERMAETIQYLSLALLSRQQSRVQE